MYSIQTTIEQQIESEMATIQKELSLLTPPASASEKPCYHLEQKNALRGDFNRTADAGATKAYFNALSQRSHLIARLDHCRRRLNAVRVHRVYAANFGLAA